VSRVRAAFAAMILVAVGGGAVGCDAIANIQDGTLASGDASVVTDGSAPSDGSLLGDAPLGDGSVSDASVSDSSVGDGGLADALGDGAPPVCTTSTCATYISAGGNHTCAVMGDNTVKCWGENGSGQCGPNADGGLQPVVVSGIGPALQVHSGVASTCALLNDKSVWCWGSNQFGQLGGAGGSIEPDGALVGSAMPVEVLSNGSASDLVVGTNHACALPLDTDAAVECWGRNNFGQAGVVDAAVVVTPTPVALGNVLGLNAGAAETCFHRSSPPLAECIGENAEGQLGQGDGAIDSLPHPFPVPVDLPDSGGISGFVHSSGFDMGLIFRTGELAMWGADDVGQLGLLIDSGEPQPVPTIIGLDLVSGVALGQSASCVFRSDAQNTVWCWGSTAYGQTGNTQVNGPVQYAPAQVSNLSGVVRITAGTNHFCVGLPGGAVECWGSNNLGQLGRPTKKAYDATPELVQF
jgi:alpha-tubulin suppressor-like RCC1 family protein